MYGDTFSLKTFNEKFENGEGLAINLLHKKLEENNIPHEYITFKPTTIFDPRIGGQIFYGGEAYPDPNCQGDVIQIFQKSRLEDYIYGSSYGAEDNLLEAMGFDIADGDVRGFMSVDEAYEMIKKWHDAGGRNAENH